ncbi:MAG: putative DNA binding domain-containing protein [Flavobacteriales bacterium]|nr:MAG: putative DNA binding domain-containing protein [Flavobacteriales bacterium]
MRDGIKWVCGFANAQGGSIFIGKDDKGKAVHVEKCEDLMDAIPNKIRNLMGITTAVNMHLADGKSFIEIVVPPYSVPISLRGRYYYRSGSTKQELTGTSLNEFLLERSGRTWDDVVEPRASFDDIDPKSIAIYLKAAKNAGRLPEDLDLALPELLEKLRLTVDGKLKRAAIILFGKDPGKFYPNTFVKVGRFGKDDADLKFQEVEEGNLITLVQAVQEQLNRKFLVKAIDFEGMHRIEKGQYPTAAIREMLLNALIHRNYMGAPVQIRVYDQKMSIWNEGFLPKGLTLAALKRSHASRPRNPILADVAFKGGYIDAWGRGTIKIIDSCTAAELPDPAMAELDGGFLLTITRITSIQVAEHVAYRVMNARQQKALKHLKEHRSLTNEEYRALFDVSRRTALRDLDGLVTAGEVERMGDLKGARYVLLNGA